jgi:hypothetical protein
MKRLITLLSILSVAAPLSLAQNHLQETMHHPGQMHHAMSTAKLTVTNDPSGQAWIIRIGPVNLPAHADHMTVAQPPDFFMAVQTDGWLSAFHPRLVDDAGKPVPNKLLHHVAFWNTSRRDFLCPNKEEHVFGAGGEMNDWPTVPGFGYRVQPADRIRVSTMFANPTDTSYPKVYLEVREEYQLAQLGAAPLKSVYPVWFDVMECRNSGYALAPGKNVTTGNFTLGYSGVLLGVGGHLHDYGQQLVLEDTTSGQVIATLDSKLDPAGRILSMPVDSFADRGGYRLDKGEVVRVTATYNNPTGKRIPEGAMGIVVGYFLPDEDKQLAAMARRRK